MKFKIMVGLIALWVMTACSSPMGTSTESGSEQRSKLFVVAATSIIGDVVSNVGGDLISLTTLVPSGMDPHTFVAAPQDARDIASADIFFVNGFEYEDFLPELLDIAGEGINVVELSEMNGGIDAILFGVHREHSDDAHQAEDVHVGAGAGSHQHGSFDPHVWMNPNHIVVWVRNIEAVLSESDPANATVYSANADAYVEKVLELDGWIEAQIAQISPEMRKIIADHDVFGYYIQRYGFELIGTIMPSYSTISSPSALEIAQIIRTIRVQNIPAIFVGTTANPNIAKQVTSDTGAAFVSVYTDALSDADGPASTYLDYMRYNTIAIVDVLK